MKEKGHIIVEGKKIRVWLEIQHNRHSWHNCLQIRKDFEDGTFLKDESDILQDKPKAITRLEDGKKVNI